MRFGSSPFFILQVFVFELGRALRKITGICFAVQHH